MGGGAQRPRRARPAPRQASCARVWWCRGGAGGEGGGRGRRAGGLVDAGAALQRGGAVWVVACLVWGGRERQQREGKSGGARKTARARPLPPCHTCGGSGAAGGVLAGLLVLAAARECTEPHRGGGGAAAAISCTRPAGAGGDPPTHTLTQPTTHTAYCHTPGTPPVQAPPGACVGLRWAHFLLVAAHARSHGGHGAGLWGPGMQGAATRIGTTGFWRAQARGWRAVRRSRCPTCAPARRTSPSSRPPGR